MAAVVLPNACAHLTPVPLPPAPAAPPSLADAERAIRRRQLVQFSFEEGCCDADCFGAAQAYERHVLEARLPVALQAAGAGAAVQATLIPVLQRQSRLINSTRFSGAVRDWEIVPFRNGEDPTGPPHNLPPITSQADALALSHANCVAYLAGYQRPPLNNDPTRREDLANFCGRL